MSGPSSRREPVVRVSHLSKRFRLFHERNQSLKQSLLKRRRSSYEDFWALKNISFDVFEGETFGIIGHNGSGKSTMLKCLTNILEPDQGTDQGKVKNRAVGRFRTRQPANRDFGDGSQCTAE